MKRKRSKKEKKNKFTGRYKSLKIQPEHNYMVLRDSGLVRLWGVYITIEQAKEARDTLGVDPRINEIYEIDRNKEGKPTGRTKIESNDRNITKPLPD